MGIFDRLFGKKSKESEVKDKSKEKEEVKKSTNKKRASFQFYCAVCHEIMLETTFDTDAAFESHSLTCGQCETQFSVVYTAESGMAMVSVISSRSPPICQRFQVDGEGEIHFLK